MRIGNYIDVPVISTAPAAQPGRTLIYAVGTDVYMKNPAGIEMDLTLQLESGITPTPTNQAVGLEGTETTAARADHRHGYTVGAPVAVGLVASNGTANSLTRGDHVHPVPGGFIYSHSLLTATASNSSQTQTAAMTTASLPAGKYKFVWRGAYTTSGTGVGLRLSVGFSGTSSLFLATGEIYTSTTASNVSAITTQGSVLGTGTASGGSTAIPFEVYGSIVITAAGALSFSHAPSATLSTSNILAGSSVEVSIIP